MPQGLNKYISWRMTERINTSVKKISTSNFRNYFSYSIYAPSTNLSSVAIICKLINSLPLNSFGSIRTYPNYILMCTLQYRMKMIEPKKTQCVGFVDPDKIHTNVVQTNPVETQRNLLRFLRKQHYCTDILFPYNFK